MSSKNSPAVPNGRDAALDRLKKAQAAVGAALPLFSGKERTAEQTQALKAAMEELAAASKEAEAFAAEDDHHRASAIADMHRRLDKGG